MANFGIEFAFTLKPALAMNSSGADYGQVSNVGTQVWGLGYGSNQSVLGGTALQWGTTPSIGFLGASPAAQITGWGTPTGASIQNNFAGGAATLATLGAAVAKLITDLKTFGLYGA